MREIGLVDVSCCNIVLASPDAIHIGNLSLVRMKRHLDGWRCCGLRACSLYLCCERGQPILPFAVEFFARLPKKPLSGRTIDEVNAVGVVFDCRDHVKESKL